MSKVLASTLSEKPVMKSDGTKLGTVHNVTMNLETGALETVYVSPPADASHGIETTDDGLIPVSARYISGLDDYLIVERAGAE
ncbi:PRC-barrel domain-containing protein [Halopiger djelfimassiliensis]|uniref:PRC-barrel domain-containing protein n=1 Tax=Halopiger djelfimassiliensis TaxID=1293047 RepID=UPI000677FF81|nr:PRC-barrel domain-containing protein [Halopiger djelfimassiliensis]